MSETYQFLYTANSIEAAQAAVRVLQPILHWPSSILDLGCGVGAWSKAFADSGVPTQTLVDHPANQANNLVFRPTSFLQIDLETELPPVHRVDLGICVEVVEHLSEKRALAAVHYLSACTDTILFSAAVPRQGGVQHINEQFPHYWQELFKSLGFTRYDCIREHLLHQANIPFHFKQNLYLFVRNKQVFRGDPPANWLPDDFELVHDWVYQRPLSITEITRAFPGAITRAWRNLRKR